MYSCGSAQKRAFSPFASLILYDTLSTEACSLIKNETYTHKFSETIVIFSPGLGAIQRYP